MASEKKPSIYYDRGTIGSSTELDEYGVWVKSEPQDVIAAESQPDTAGGSREDAAPVEDFSIDKNLSPESPVAETEEPGDISSFDDTPIDVPPLGDTSIIEEPLTLADPEPQASVPVEFASEAEGRGSPQEAASEAEGRGSPQEAAPEAEGPGPGSPQEYSPQFLMNVADELASIRNELAALKNELSAIRSGDIHRDERDDEKTVLTGDELDNILNTADFTEETGTDAGASIPEDTADTGASVPEDAADDGADALEKTPTEAAGEDLPLEDLNLSPSDEAALDEFALTDEPLDLVLDENSVDLPNAVIDDKETARDDSLDEELSIDELSLSDLEGLGDEISLDPESSETPVTVDLDLEESAEDAADLSEFSVPSPDVEEELELSISDFSAGNESNEAPAEDTLPPLASEEEESFAQVIPEGFVVEEEDAVVSDDDRLETAFEEPREEETTDSTDLELVAVDRDSPPDLTLDDGLEEEAGENPVAEEETSAPLPLEEETLEEAVPETPGADIPAPFKQELKTVLSYMDQLLESLPEEKIEEFAKSKYFDTYRKLFKELGIV
ncbi:hypothetical protein FACS1894163_03450 [Spirochaetia bacterium]|nr:hypothetical protein FACS1894163_03450 [Spirochaetia bacterium]